MQTALPDGDAPAFAQPARLPLVPGKRLPQALAALVTLALVLALLPEMPGERAATVFAAAAALLAALAALDAAVVWRRADGSQLEVERSVPSALAIGVARQVGVRLRNRSTMPLRLSLADHAPAALQADGLPCEVLVPPLSEAALAYGIRPVRRGPADCGLFEVLVDSGLGRWRRRRWVGLTARTRVYPNFAAVAHYASLATDHNLARVGVRQRRRRGEGLEFHQLREYRSGDSLRQIDWKATTRQSKLISREHQDERDQRLVFMLDASRRMRAKDGALSHFDQALDSMMLLAHVALRQGDAVGALAFGMGRGEHRFFAPDKGGAALERLTNTFYDLEPQPCTGDYLEAAKALMRRVPKRSMVILLTNLRDEDEAELMSALRVLRSKHLVVLASLRESALEEMTRREVTDFDAALAVAAGHVHLEERERAFAALTCRGIPTLDVPPARLPIALVNAYIEITRSARL